MEIVSSDWVLHGVTLQIICRMFYGVELSRFDVDIDVIVVVGCPAGDSIIYNAQ